MRSRRDDDFRSAGGRALLVRGHSLEHFPTGWNHPVGRNARQQASSMPTARVQRRRRRSDPIAARARHRAGPPSAAPPALRRLARRLGRRRARPLAALAAGLHGRRGRALFHPPRAARRLDRPRRARLRRRARGAPVAAAAAPRRGGRADRGHARLRLGRARHLAGAPGPAAAEPCGGAHRDRAGRRNPARLAPADARRRQPRRRHRAARAPPSSPPPRRRCDAGRGGGHGAHPRPAAPARPARLSRRLGSPARRFLLRSRRRRLCARTRRRGGARRPARGRPLVARGARRDRRPLHRRPAGGRGRHRRHPAHGRPERHPATRPRRLPRFRARPSARRGGAAYRHRHGARDGPGAPAARALRAGEPALAQQADRRRLRPAGGRALSRADRRACADHPQLRHGLPRRARADGRAAARSRSAGSRSPPSC